MAWDHQHYITMALEPWTLVPAPFSYRILAPAIARLLPFSVEVSFQIITYVSLFMCGLALYGVFKKKVNKALAFTGMTLFFSLEFAPRFLVYDFWLPDALAFFIIIVCFLALEDSRFDLYAVILCLGVLCKETVLFTTPIFLFMYLSKRNVTRNELFKAAALITPALLLFVFLRVIIQAVPGSDYNYFQLLQIFGQQRLLNLESEVFRYTITSWGLILFVYPLFSGKQQLLLWIKQYGVFMFLVYSQLLLAINTERLIVLGFIPMILITLHGMERFSGNSASIDASFVVMSVVYFVYRLVANAPFGFSDPFIFRVAFLIVGLGLPLFVRMLWSNRQRKPYAATGECQTNVKNPE